MSLDFHEMWALLVPQSKGILKRWWIPLSRFWLPAWQPKVKVRERGKPKFYFFDTGVVRALAGRAQNGFERFGSGTLLEPICFTKYVQQ